MIFRTCQFIGGEPKDREFCGVETMDLKAWCEDHQRMVFNQKGNTSWDRENGPAVHRGGKRHFKGKLNFTRKK